MRGVWLILGLIGLSTAAVSPAVQAHGAKLQTRTRLTVEVQATYDSGDPMKAAQVQVYSPQNPDSPYLKGTTDSQGVYRFVPPESGNWEVAVRQAGHGDITVIPVDLETSTVVDPSTDQLIVWQRMIIIGSVIWGCVGTALYFRRRQT
ncbi:carboxypeptidase regulatory-like domain-containing protein [Lyngbya confervoides]|uniref:Carboxypeptidase regulatory-like domain-containing protein n=1 Tax=Lyngbya confervoides BDU141951 TaxID=1574623 RepID=A0ABD4T676_9CYAN|nr:carboxypeptidase regulatory-like domain-containing protein [Lyngbya confervoides]MCM1984276.1 carboxypeptidase regulatory-like domain-containing protein [Lyngbya confervoides BDU141951]